MRRVMLIAAATGTGLIAAGVLGAANAQSPAPVAPRTVSVQGVGSAAIDSASSADSANAAYRRALASALADGQSKGAFLAGRVGGALGAVHSVGEGGGYIDCGQGEFTGTQPDFGSGQNFAASSTSSLAAGAPVRVRPPASGKKNKNKKKKKHVRGKAHVAATCTLNAQVSLVYALS